MSSLEEFAISRLNQFVVDAEIRQLCFSNGEKIPEDLQSLIIKILRNYMDEYKSMD